MNDRITEARKNGVQTLIDKLLQVFQYQQVENPNQILWIREKTKFITFLANKLTDLYSDNKYSLKHFLMNFFKSIKE